MHQSLLVKYRKDPYLSLKLIGLLAFSLICGVTAAAFPEKPRSELTSLDKIFKSLAAIVTIAGGAGAIAATIHDESQALEKDCAQAVADHLTVKQFQSEGAFYRNNKMALRLGLPVPDKWHHDYAQTGGKYMQLTASSNHEVVLPQPPVPEAAPISEARALAEKMMDPSFVELDRLGLVDDIPAKQPKQTVAQIAAKQLTRPEYQDLSNMEFLDRIEESDYSWIDELVTYPTVLVFGAPGSGKTSFAQHLICQRLELGHTVIVLDPHNRVGKWGQCKVIGGGRKHQAIANFISLVENEIINPRYRAYEQGQEHFPPITIVTEELTNWAINVDGSEKLIEFIPDYRKINVNLLMVAHSNTLGALGGKAGFKKVLEDSMMQLKLLAKPSKDPNKRVEPAMQGWLWGPELPKSQVEIPLLSDEIAETLAPQGSDSLGTEPEIASETPESSPQEANSPPESETEITEREAELFQILSGLGHTQTQIIKAIWDANPGQSKGYQKALVKYRHLKLQAS